MTQSWRKKVTTSMLGYNTLYPAFFRVAISFVLLLDILIIYPNLHDIYNLPHIEYFGDNTLPWLRFLRINIHSFFLLYAISLLLWIFGIGKRITSLVVLIFYVNYLYLNQPVVSWGDNILAITLGYFQFVNSFRHFAIKKNVSRIHLIHRLAIWSILFNIILIYMDNAYFKLHNNEWLSGYALAYFFNASKTMDIFGFGDLFNKTPWIIKLSTWCILIFQATLPIAVWFKKTKFIWLGLGAILHVLMGFVLQLYRFEIIIVLLYGFFITDEEWRSLFNYCD